MNPINSDPTPLTTLLVGELNKNTMSPSSGLLQ